MVGADSDLPPTTVDGRDRTGAVGKSPPVVTLSSVGQARRNSQTAGLRKSPAQSSACGK